MVLKYSKRPMKTEHGFSVVELMVALAIAGVLLGVAVPSVQNWRRNYNIKSAVTDLYAAMQTARIGAIKSNRQWTMTFESSPVPGYTVRDADDEPYPRTAIPTPTPRVRFPDKYRGAIAYGSPTSAGPIDAPTMRFDQRGLVINPGFVYLKGTNTLTYYRVGTLYGSSAVKIQRWNGTTWQ